MLLIGARGQQASDRSYRLDGKITTGSTTQLLTPIPNGRSFLNFQNISSNAMYLEFGSARATATITNGAVSSVTITNGGFGFLMPPIVHFEGGAAFCPLTGAGPSGAGLPGYAAPSNFPNNAGYRPATAHSVLTGGVVTSIVIDDGGAGYAFAPYVDVYNAYGDRYGCADPFYGAVNSGLYMAPGMTYWENGTVCPTEQVSVWCATTGSPFFFRWTP